MDIQTTIRNALVNTGELPQKTGVKSSGKLYGPANGLAC